VTDHTSLANATWWLVYATFALVATGLITIAFAWVQIRSQRKQTRVDNLELLIQWFESDRLRHVRQQLAKSRLATSGLRKLDPDDVPDPALEILDFFEHVAFLVRRNHVEVYDVWHTFVHWIAALHTDLGEYIAVEQHYDKTVYCDFVWLFSELQKVEKQESGEPIDFDEDDLEGHYNYEKSLEGVRVPTRRRRSKRHRGDTQASKSDGG
jgi:hypothetical protein